MQLYKNVTNSNHLFTLLDSRTAIVARLFIQCSFLHYAKDGVLFTELNKGDRLAYKLILF